MQRVDYPSPEEIAELLKRPVMDNKQLVKQVGKIIADVQKNGDRALRRYSKRFDSAPIKSSLIKKKQIAQAEKLISQQLKDAMLSAYDNIKKFHASQLEVSARIETSPGVYCWRKSLPIQRAGFYIPGGSAPLFSTILMLGIPAQLVGCKEIVLCTPPSKEGTIHPAILYAAKLVGITEIHLCGGAQAIAAMAYGTKSISKVDKIFGPGNQYVTTAKQLVQMDGIAIDMPAGPSEVCVLADSTANPDFVAADLLSQAEHGPDSQVILVSNSDVIIDKTLESINRQLELLERKDIAIEALAHSRAILVKDIKDGLEVVNAYASEHLIIACDDAQDLADQVEHAGSVFLGHYTPESAGDYASGTNHTLPTNGYARAYSGVSCDSFVRKVTFQHITEDGIKQLGKTIIAMAEAEGLDAHANAVKIRINKQ